MKKKIIFVHGLGVRKDARGMFTDIEQSLQVDKNLKDIECIFTDLNIVDQETGNLKLNPLSTQAEIIKKVYDKEISNLQENGEVFLICHSQGCVVAAIADLPNIKKTIFIAPPINNDIQRSVDRFKVRPGTIINTDQDSHVMRSDSSITIIPKEYWEDRREMNYLDNYKKFAQKNDLEIIFGKQDEIVLVENIGEIEKLGKSYIIDGDHNFKGESRVVLEKLVRNILIG